MTIMKPGPEDASPVPQLDLGKKVSTPQDLMIEELSLRNNRGSQLFQQRQRRMQRFVFEHPSGYREPPGPGGSHRTKKGGAEGTANEWTAGEDAGGQQSYHSELHVAASPQGSPPEVPKKTEKVLQMSKILNPDVLAPGYSGPLKEIPPEKFNVTAIPKGYRSPWQELLGDKDNAAYGENQPPMRPSPWDFRSFNRRNRCCSLPGSAPGWLEEWHWQCQVSLLISLRTPTPFDRALLSNPFSVPTTELDNLSILEVISHRPNFNRVPQGWVRILPESDEL
ncbi:myozenin-3 isoform 1-T1 [Rhynochetos jubatus]